LSPGADKRSSRHELSGDCSVTSHPLNIWGISIDVLQSKEAHEGLTIPDRPQDIAQSGSGRELRHYATGADSGADRVRLATHTSYMMTIAVIESPWL